MKPIYFPFTYVPQWVAETLAAYFKQFTVYQASGRKLPAEMQLWAAANMMEVRVPVRTDEEALSKVVKDFQAFASLHDDWQYLKTEALCAHQGEIPFFGEAAVSRIASEVKKSSRKAPGATHVDPLLCARAFLEFAHEYDRQSDELCQELGVHDRRSHDLLAKIRGEKDDDLAAAPLTAEIRVEDPAEYMALGRFQAWLRLYMLAPAKSGLFVTNSQSVFNHLMENQATAEKVMQSECLPVLGAQDDASDAWRDSFLQKMKWLIENRWDAPEDTFADLFRPDALHSKTALTLYRVPGQSPAHLFSRIFKDQNLDPTRPGHSVEFPHTLIGLISRQPVNS